MQNISTGAKRVKQVSADTGAIMNSCDQLLDLMDMIFEKTGKPGTTVRQLANLIGLAFDLSARIHEMVSAVEAAEATAETK